MRRNSNQTSAERKERKGLKVMDEHGHTRTDTDEARVVHCWEDKASWMAEVYGMESDEYVEAFENPGTCLLEKGHASEHEWTPDEDIGIEFL